MANVLINAENVKIKTNEEESKSFTHVIVTNAKIGLF